MIPDGFAKIDRALVNRISDIGCTAASVYLALAGHADEARRCHPSVATLARLLGSSDRTIRAALATLRSHGLIETDLGTGTRTTRYYLPPVNGRKQASGAEAGFRGGRKQASGEGGSTLPPERETKNKRQRTTGGRKQASPPNGRFDPMAVDLPFPSERFTTAWGDFVDHRRAIKHPLTEAATKRIIAKLADWGEDDAVAALDLSIENGWRGVFEPSGKANGNGHANGRPKHTGPAPLTADEIAELNAGAYDPRSPDGLAR